MREVTVPPKAAALSDSMRDLGYSFEAAVADIIDNSISASATKVDIFLDTQGPGFKLAIIDDGSGMTGDELLLAMRHGAISPRAQRSKEDLGRFGLGLKTASFSQCMKLTVITSKNGLQSGAVWDLCVVAEKDDWIVGVLEEDEISDVPYAGKLENDGTLVLWEKLDRLCEGNTAADEKLILEKIRELEKHLSLVFHRFLNGEIKGRKLNISINYHEVQPFDPFCIANKATQILNQEIIRIKGEEVLIQPYILPHHSKLSQKERDFYNSRSDFLNNQGVYVYRNGRLMAWGDWFRLIPKGEATKLARVKIDFTNALDEHWTIDIKKSHAYPPYPVRSQLKKIIGRIADSSVRVHSVKGKRLYTCIPKPIWLRTAKKGTVEYSLDRHHPIITAIEAALMENDNRKIGELLSVIECSIPIEMIYSDYSVNPHDFESCKEFEPLEIVNKLEEVWNILSINQKITENSFREVVCFLKPYCDYSEIIDEFIRRKVNV